MRFVTTYYFVVSWKPFTDVWMSIIKRKKCRKFEKLSDLIRVKLLTVTTDGLSAYGHIIFEKA